MSGFAKHVKIDEGEILTILQGDEEVVGDFIPVNVKEEPTDIQETTGFGPSNITIEVGDDVEDKDLRGREFALALRTMLKTDSAHRKKEIRFEARKWMGAVLFKDVGGVRYMGRVVDYHVETGWFKVMYDDFEYEEMEKDELIQLLANPEQYRPYFDRLPASSLDKRNPKRKKAPKQKKPAERSSSYKEKPRSAAKKPSSYIPLAIREKKRDDYYWY